MRNLIIVVSIFVLVVSCNNDDDGPVIQAPSIAYETTALDAVFFHEGNAIAPTVNWNGHQGNFSLNTTINGLRINSTTGTINWTKILPPGTHNVQIIASNSAGQTTVNLTINNPFQGTFTGTYDNTTFFEMEFNADGTVEVRAEDPTTPLIAPGTWTLINDTILVNYTYDINNQEYSSSGELTLTETNANYSGDWYWGHGAVSGAEGGTFEITLN